MTFKANFTKHVYIIQRIKMKYEIVIVVPLESCISIYR